MVLKEISQEAIDQAKEQVNEILSTLNYIETGRNPYKCRFIEANDPRIVNAGNHSIVIGLEPIVIDSAPTYLVAKLPRHKGHSDSRKHVITGMYSRNPFELEKIMIEPRQANRFFI